MRKYLQAIVCVIGLAISSSGCIFLAAGAAGAGTVKWMSDKVTSEVDSPMAKVDEAGRQTFKDLKVALTKETVTSEVIQLQGLDASGRKVWVDIHPLGTERSRIDVRVGWINGEADAHVILEKIAQKAQSWI